MKYFTKKDLILKENYSPELSYVSGVVKRGIHIGQAKLFFSELLVLTNYFDKIDIVLYIGSSRGKHINFFPELFTGIQVYCYDPADSEIDTSLDGIFEYRKYFDDEDIEYWKERSKKEKILLISDIRTFVPGTISNKEEQKKIKIDMALQKKWVDEIQPYVFHLKFRMPYYFDSSDLYFEYLDGDIYIEPWNHSGSTENRLVGVRKKNGFPTRKWNTKKYENMCFYLNVNVRNPEYYNDENSFYNIITKDERAYNKELGNDIDSTITMYTIYEYYKKFKKLPKDPEEKLEELVKFFYECMSRITYKKKTISYASELDKRNIFLNKYLEDEKFFSYKGKKYNIKKFYYDVIKQEYIHIPDFSENDRQNILINVKNENLEYIFKWYPIGKSMHYGPDYIKGLDINEKNILLKYIKKGVFEIINPILDNLDINMFVEYENVLNFFGRFYNLLRYQNFVSMEDREKNQLIIRKFLQSVIHYLK